MDFLLLEMRYDPKRMEAVFKAAKETKAPIWAGFSLRRGANGKIVSLTDQAEIPFLDLIEIAQNYRIDVMGIMHTSVDLISEAVKILRSSYKGPIMVYPDSGGWLSPNWDFSTVISPEMKVQKKGSHKNRKPQKPQVRVLAWLGRGLRPCL